MPPTQRFFMQLALGLATLAGMQPVVAGDGGPADVRAWVAFDERGSTVTISGHAVAARPLAARYSLVIESVSRSGTSRSRDSSRVLLGAEPTTLARIAIATSEPRRIDVRLDIEPQDGLPLQVRETYPMNGVWVMAH